MAGAKRKPKERLPHYVGRVKRVGTLLASAIERQQTSMNKVAQATKLSRNTVQKLASGDFTGISFVVFMAVCEVLGVDPVAIWQDRPGADRRRDGSDHPLAHLRPKSEPPPSSEERPSSRPAKSR